jgi:sulfur-oxidizing protein SoxZ
VIVARAIVNLPASARRGDIIEIKALVAHDMETGFRRTQLGALIPRNIITSFVCTYNGAEIFRAEFYPAISANPYLAFSTRANESGTIACTWTGDNGYSLTESAAISVA